MRHDVQGDSRNIYRTASTGNPAFRRLPRGRAGEAFLLHPQPVPLLQCLPSPPAAVLLIRTLTLSARITIIKAYMLIPQRERLTAIKRSSIQGLQTHYVCHLRGSLHRLSDLKINQGNSTNVVPPAPHSTLERVLILLDAPSPHGLGSLAE